MHPFQVFGETMMLVYYGYALPLSLEIGRGFYEDGIWSDGGFMPYSHIGGLTWREGEQLTLVLMLPMRAFARRLTVPETLLRRGTPGAARQDRRARHPLHRQDRSTSGCTTKGMMSESGMLNARCRKLTQI